MKDDALPRIGTFWSRNESGQVFLVFRRATRDSVSVMWYSRHYNSPVLGRIDNELWKMIRRNSTLISGPAGGEK